MTIVIKMTGKASHVFKLISLFAVYRGEHTIGKIVEEKEKCNIPVMLRKRV